ncbi:MAG: hypothetical protein JWL83_1983 [Actinomycetia bacterium]|jgi:hypothetical protein|nr:hypothetical protein [Actinomycetes bacterium]
MPPRTKKRPMSDEHKAALAEGRNLSRSVSRYLEALEAHKPKRGRKRTPESVKKQLSAVHDSIKAASGARRLELIQQRRDLEVEMAGMQAGGPDLTALEQEFVKSAKGYSDRKGITYGTWREFGVPAEVLRKAGIGRGA